MIQNSFLEKGKEKELEFALALCKAKSLSSSIIEEASKEDDIYRHIDIWVGANSFDVKAARKKSREEEIQLYGKPLPKTKIKESKKIYKRNKKWMY